MSIFVSIRTVLYMFRRVFLPTATEIEDTEKFCDLGVPLFHVRHLLRRLVRVFRRDGCCQIDDGDARRHLVRDAESRDGVPQQQPAYARESRL